MLFSRRSMIARQSLSVRSTSTFDGLAPGMDGDTGPAAVSRSRPSKGVLAASERDFARPEIDCCYGRIETNVDRLARIEALIAQREPFLRRAAGEIVLRQIGRSTGGASSLLSMTMLSSYFCRRSVSVAANPLRRSRRSQFCSVRHSWGAALLQPERASHPRRSCRRAAPPATYRPGRMPGRASFASAKIEAGVMPAAA